jgi:hypothetical protein
MLNRDQHLERFKNKNFTDIDKFFLLEYEALKESLMLCRNEDEIKRLQGEGRLLQVYIGLTK